MKKKLMMLLALAAAIGLYLARTDNTASKHRRYCDGQEF